MSQIAVLPAFAHARSNSVLTALVSGDPRKLKALSRKYRTSLKYFYEEYDRCLTSGEIDAVYIGNHQLNLRFLGLGHYPPALAFVIAMGFSQRTCIPARAAASVYAAWKWWGNRDR
jgi:hypothetical protein